MRKISFYTYTIFNMVSTMPAMVKLNILRKHGTEQEIEDHVYDTVSNWSRTVLKKTGVKVLVKGQENIPECSCLFVSNHQGNFDFLAMMGFIDKPIGFIAKAELSKYPYFPKWMDAMHCVFIDRENMRQSVKAINTAAENLRNGHSIVIFPEGTRSRKHEMNEFKKGSLKLAERGKAPIVPVTVDGSYKIYEANDCKRIIPGEVKIIIDKPIYLDNLSREEKKQVIDNIPKIVEGNLNNMEW